MQNLQNFIMVDISIYRSRIGTFIHSRRLRFKKFDKVLLSQGTRSQKAGRTALKSLEIVLILVILSIFGFARPPSAPGTSETPLPCSQPPWWRPAPALRCQGRLTAFPSYQFQIKGKKQSSNFLAKYRNGNTRKGILNLHLNIRSVKNKVLEVKNIVKSHNPHLLGLSECELKKKNNRFDENLLKIPGYVTLFPKSWSTKGHARTLVYVKKTLEFEQVHDLEQEEVQSIWVKGGFKNGKKIYFCHGYREHTSSAGISSHENLLIFLKQWEAAINHNNPPDSNEVHISGDMNLDSLEGRWLDNDYSLIALSRLVKSCCDANNLHQIVKGITRVQYNSVTETSQVSCIDHVYTNAKHRCSEVEVIAFGSSDHDMIGYTRYSKVPPAPARSVKKRSYKNFDSAKFLEDLSFVTWDDVLSCPDLDLATEIFTYKFKSVLDIHAPWIRYQQRKFFCPWLTEEMRKLMIQRDRVKKHAKELAMRDISCAGNVSDEQKEAWSQFKILRNKINNLKKNEEIKFKKQKISENLSNPATVWSTAKSFMNWKSPGTPQQLEVNGNLETKASGIASIMNNFFIKKVKRIRENIAPVHENLEDCTKVMIDKRCDLKLQHVSIKTIEKIIQNLKNSKSLSVDELDSFSVRLASKFIATPVHHLVTLSIMEMKFPTNWKLTKVIPLHKKESLLDPSNYRPVAILSPLSKILEKVIYKQLYDYFSKNKIFHSSLHGYRQNRSTQTALLQLYDTWVRSAAQGQVSGVVLLDLSAAFDLVDHEILVKKLKIYGVDRDFCTWVGSYLHGRQQAVWIDHTFSEFLPNSVGVPQGNILGPLFFLIYFNDLLSTLSCKVEVYADDSTLTESGPNVQEIESKLTENCRKVSIWMKENKLKLNAIKTHFLLVGTQERLRVTQQPHVIMDGVHLEENADKCESLLGVQVKANLKWSAQISKVSAKLKMRLVGLTMLKYLVPYETRNTIVIGIFNSILIYCLPLYGGCNKGQIKDLQVLQNKAGQLVAHKPPHTNRNALFDQLGWMSVSQLIVYHTVLLVFKIRKASEPEYLATFLKNDGRTGKIIIPNTKLGLTQKSFCYRGSANWNTLPEDLRKSVNIGTFKFGLKKWILQNIPRFPD